MSYTFWSDKSLKNEHWVSGGASESSGRNKWYETQMFQGGSKFHSVQWSLNSWPFAGRSGTGQCTHCRGGAESVLTFSTLSAVKYNGFF